MSTIAADLLAAGADDAVAIEDGNARLTYARLRAEVAAVAARLDGEGLPPRCAVAVVGANSPAWVAAYLGIVASGRVAVPLAADLLPRQLHDALTLTGSAAAFVDPRPQRALAQVAPGLPTFPLLPVRADDAAPATGPLPERPGVGADDDAVYLLTSGSTAAPKVVRLTHANLRANTASILGYLPIDATDRMLVVLPFCYTFGASLLHTHLAAGATLVLCRTFAYPETAAELLETARCTSIAGVPSVFQTLLRTTSFPRRDLPHLRHLQQAGGKLPARQVTELAAAHPHARLYVMYGQTEGTARLSYLPPEELERRPGSIGRGIPGVRLRVVGEDGRDVAPGAVGEIRVAGANISPGYLGDPDATAAAFVDGELRTGDLATVDEDGFVFVVDRSASFIKTLGHRVAAGEVEEAALGLPDLVSAVAVGVPDEALGEAVALICAARPGAGVTEDDVRDQCLRELPRWAVPRTVVLVDRVPLNPHGKVDRAAARALALPATDPTTPTES